MPPHTERPPTEGGQSAIWPKRFEVTVAVADDGRVAMTMPLIGGASATYTMAVSTARWLRDSLSTAIEAAEAQAKREG